MLIVSDERFHLFKQDKELSSMMCRRIAILVLAIDSLTIQKGEDFWRVGPINRHKPTKSDM